MTELAEPDQNSGGLSRRRLLLAGAGGAAGVLVGAAPQAAAHGALISRNYLGSTGCHLYYPGIGRYSFSFNERFYNRLGYWKNEISGPAPDAWGWVSRIYALGAHVDPPASEGMHNYGRAFDITRVYFMTGDTLTERFDMRYDVWRDKSDMSFWRTRYWGLMGSLHYRFRHVISYLDNSNHHNHIHVDDAVYSLTGDSRFDSSSTTQTLFVQAACTWVWGETTARDGDYGPNTRTASNAVLRRIGRSGYLHDNQANWQAFCQNTYTRAIAITT